MAVPTYQGAKRPMDRTTVQPGAADGVTTQGVPSLNQTTPPVTAGKRSWLGVDPKQTMTQDLAKQGIEGYLGRALTPAEIQRAMQVSGYGGSGDLTGDMYNKILQEGANLTGGVYTPYSTTAPVGGGVETTQPVPGPGTSTPPPTLTLPEYQKPGDFKFDAAAFEADPSYRWRTAEGQRALENAAAAKGMARGGNHMIDLINYGQNAASQEYGAAFDRAASTDAINRGEGRYAHEQNTARAAGQFAPSFAAWNRDRDEAWRREELGFDRDWQREVYGRDDSWRRHVYANDDLWRRYQTEENRRLEMARMGLT